MSNISSRTPEGFPSQCPVCGASISVEYSDPPGDAVCPRCGSLVWKAAELFNRITEIVEEQLNTTAQLDHNTRLGDMGVDSLDTVELVIELEEEFNVHIPEEVAADIETLGDFVREVMKRRKG